MRKRRGSMSFSVPLGIAVVVLATSPAQAIPAFARKYATSCQTCHIAYPRLTPFGEAFRLNGYRFPEGGDATVSKDEPVSLGSEGYKKLWPKAVWPGEIPGKVPFSAIIESEIEYEPGEDPRAQLSTLGGEVALLAAGTFGESVSFYSEIEFESGEEETEIELERLNAIFTPWGKPVFHARVGRFEPGISLVSSHRRLTTARYLLTSATVGDNAFRFEPRQAGLELSGIFAHRWLWNAGYVEGSGNEANNSKDVYGRLAFKLGGLALDGTGSGGAKEATGKSEPWSELSLTLSGFAYRGTAKLAGVFSDPAMLVPDMEVEQDDDFRISGAEAQVNIKDLIVNAGAARFENDAPFLDDPFDPALPETDVDSDLRYVELTWVALPWLIPVARLETFEVGDEEERRLAITTNLLIRANVLAFVGWLGEREPDGSGFASDEYAAGVSFGF